MGAFATLLTAAAAAGATPAVKPAPLADPVKPALWVINDHDTTIYLFGTFHALDGSADWFRGGIASAFRRSDQLVLETLLPKPGGTLPALPRTAGSAASRFGASTRMVIAASRSRGMSADRGADAALRLAAEGSGKAVAGLEPLEAQIAMFTAFASAPAAAAPAPAAPPAGPAPMQALSALLAKLQDAWVRGDMATFVPMLEQMRAQSPNAYRAMFAERNARWADWIAGRLDQPGTVFVAVGAGHLAGRDSVQAKLAAIGVGAFRIN